MDNAAVFIDGYNLYHGICDAGYRPWLWVDLVALAGLLLPGSVHLSQVNYYTAYSKEEGRRAGQGLFLEANRERNPDLRIVAGFMQEEDCCHCRQCGNASRRWQEKRTDVNMAVDIVAGAMQGPSRRFDLALLITGDADQVAAVEVALASGVRVEVRFPPERQSTHLADAVGGSSHAYPVSLAKLRKAQMPDTVHRLGGKRSILRPNEWGERTSGGER